MVLQAEARRSALRIYVSPADAEAQLAGIRQAAQEESVELQRQSCTETLARWRPQLQVAILLFFFAQASGQSNVLSYAPELFAEYLQCDELPDTLTSAGTGACTINRPLITMHD